MPARSEHGTLSAASVKTVTITSPTARVDVCNKGAAGSADIHFKWALGAAPSDPTANGDDTDFASPGGYATIETGLTTTEVPPLVVKLIGNGNAYAVIAK